MWGTATPLQCWIHDWSQRQVLLLLGGALCDTRGTLEEQFSHIALTLAASLFYWIGSLTFTVRELIHKPNASTFLLWMYQRRF